MNSAQLFDKYLQALVGEEELMKLYVEQALVNHPPACECRECRRWRYILFGHETTIEEEKR